MLKQHAKTTQTPKAVVGQRVIINKLLQHSDNCWRGTNPEDEDEVHGMVLKPVERLFFVQKCWFVNYFFNEI